MCVAWNVIIGCNDFDMDMEVMAKLRALSTRRSKVFLSVTALHSEFHSEHVPSTVF